MDRRAGSLPAPFGPALAQPVSRRAALRGLGAGAVAALLLSDLPRRVVAQAPVEVGVAPVGGIAWEGIGIIDQRGANLTAYGYLTYVAGLEEDQLYLDGGTPLARTDATARFTFFSVATLTARSVLENLFVVNADGQQSLYFNEVAGASFDRPESFFSGTEIATLLSRVHNTLNVQAPDEGIATGFSEQVQATAEPFVLDGTRVRFGRAGLLSRAVIIGQGTRSDAVLPRSTTVFSASVTVLGEDEDAATPVAG